MDGGYEAGEALDVVAPRLRELRAEREKLQHDLDVLLPLAPAPKNLLTDETIQKFQDKLRDIFISNDTPMTKNYLRFLVEEIVVFDDRVVIKAKARNAVVMMAHPEPLGTGAPTTRTRFSRRGAIGSPTAPVAGESSRTSSSTSERRRSG
jgi:hypothetical protein